MDISVTEFFHISLELSASFFISGEFPRLSDFNNSGTKFFVNKSPFRVMQRIGQINVTNCSKGTILFHLGLNIRLNITDKIMKKISRRTYECLFFRSSII